MNNIEIQFEKVEIKPGTRKLKDTWKVEIDPDPIEMYYEPDLRERIWNRILNVFGKGRKYPSHDEMTELSKAMSYEFTDEQLENFKIADKILEENRKQCEKFKGQDGI